MSKNIGSREDDSLSIDSNDNDASASFEESTTEEKTNLTGEGSSSNSGLGVGKEETMYIFRLRLLVLLAISLAAIVVSLAVYFITSNNEEEEFDNQFYGASKKVLSSFTDIVNKKLETIASLAVQSSLFVKGQDNMSWPLVTINDWDLRVSLARELSGALYASLVPVITPETREAWGEYSTENAGWLDDARAYNKANGFNFRRLDEEFYVSNGIYNQIFGVDRTGIIPVQGPGPFFPVWQESPIFNRNITNFDVNYYPDYAPYMLKSFESGEMSIGGLDTAPVGNMTSPDMSTSYFAFLESNQAGESVMYQGDPMSTVFFPVFDDFQAQDRKVVAMVFAVFKWAFYFEGLLPTNFPGLIVVLQNNCEGAFTYKVVGEQVEYIGPGNLYNDYTNRPDMVQSVDFSSVKQAVETDTLRVKLNQDLCAYELLVYPSKELEDEYVTSLPILITCAVAVVFVFTAIVFLIYNRFVERRQALVMDQAVKSTAIVTSLFPETVRDRLMDSEHASGKSRLKTFLNDNGANAGSQPIADLFPHCTVFFADIAGFTAWSSTRDPSSVFILLETLYSSFDMIAKRKGVFKVETIGDSYVAVTGLPNPNERHAIIMARFAEACVEKFGEVTKKLEHQLGPDTADLGLRVGLHSGPVTAGVLRGERARFQLFGDTVNTAARMESSGKTNKIQVSEATANLIISGGKEHWVHRRSDVLNVKGKGVMGSYWLTTTSKDGASSRGSGDSSSGFSDSPPSVTFPGALISPLAPKKDSRRQARLVQWIADLLAKRISTILARQDPNLVGKCKPSDLIYTIPAGKTSLDEVAEAIKMPNFDAEAASRAKTKGSTEIPQGIKEQIMEIVTALANTYQQNNFHNFEHACHVTMAVDKFMSRIVAPDVDEESLEAKDHARMAAHVHQYTHGITSDPITLLAITFSALIHDADHRGCSNMQLAKEDEQMAELYNNKSLAEQNSLDLAWDLLMQEKYSKLRAALFVNRTEMLRFRQVVVNVVLATDIFDKELNDLRKSRWNKAFSAEQEDEEFNNLRATIVIEHIIQASDVSHTMQHWHIYRKWNENLFMEMYTAFKQGRMGKSPVEFWYNGELGFFDNYIIPLAKKLEECNVFGVSSDECLNYATRNRREWEERGKQVVAEMVKKVESMNINWDEFPALATHQQEQAVVESCALKEQQVNMMKQQESEKAAKTTSSVKSKYDREVDC